jgi:hypothetical protein
MAADGSDDASMAIMLEALGRAAECQGSRPRQLIWCEVAEGWTTGEPSDLARHAALVGLRIPVEEGADNESAVKHYVRLVAATIRSDPLGLRISIAELVPENAEERGELAALLKPLQETLAGVVGEASVGDHLFRFLTIEATATHSVSREERGWRIDAPHPAQIRRIGSNWAIVERREQKPWRYFVSVMTDQFTSVVHR